MLINRPHLRQLRQYAGKSIRQLAKEANVSHSHLAYVESGKREPSESVVKKLADALGVHVRDLTNG